jgi:hypothetical protein
MGESPQVCRPPEKQVGLTVDGDRGIQADVLGARAAAVRLRLRGATDVRDLSFVKK